MYRTGGISRCASYLLPNYDGYLIAYKDRGAIVDPRRARHLGVFTSLEHPHHVIVDGRVAGSWRRTTAGTAVRVVVRGYEQLGRPQARALGG